MAISRSPRHWISIALASAWTVLAIMQFADFSGEPPPWWRELALTLLAPICLILLVYSLYRDRPAPPTS